jgi:hypothetical protein
MVIEEGFSPIERAATMSIACVTARLSAFRAAKRSSGNRHLNKPDQAAIANSPERNRVTGFPALPAYRTSLFEALKSVIFYQTHM